MRKMNFKKGLVVVKGHNGTIGTALENIYEASQAIFFEGVVATAVAMQLSSGSTADAAAGTGARTVRIYGLDANYKVIYEDVTLNGQTGVLTTKTFLFVFAIVCLTFGTGKVNAGVIYASPTGTTLTSGVPTAASILVQVPAGWLESGNGSYTVPARCSARAKRLSVSAGTQGLYIIIAKRVMTEAAPVFEVVFQDVVGVNAPYSRELGDTDIESFAEKTHIVLWAIGLAASANAYAKLELAVI